MLEHNRARAAHLDGLLAPLARDERVEHLRRCGMIWAFDVRLHALAGDSVRGGGIPFARRYFSAARERGVLLRPIGNTVYLMPPYVLSEDDAAHLAQGALGALDAVVGR